MSERKVLTKYYPPDFDPRQLQQRVRGPKNAGPKVQTVRLMAPFSMRCTTCGEYIYKGRKFNARKETPDEKYLGIQIFRFYIRCTRCSAEITFKTDPKNQDYACERGAKRNTEPWRVGREETDEERLDRLEQEEEERNAMVELEAKTVDAKREMAVADALDEIRTRNARLERADRDGVEMALPLDPEDEAAMRADREDEEAARRAFAKNARQLDIIEDEILED
ncbi:CWC16 protein, partial [Xylariales sp. PMI_506]